MEIPADFQLGPKMQACTEKERLFVWAQVIGGAETNTDAARMAGYSDTGVGGGIRGRAYDLMHRERVLQAMEELGRQAFRAQLPVAVRANLRLLEKVDHPDHHKAVQATLSRLGLAEKVGIDVNVSGSVEVSHTDAAVQDLRVLLGLGVSREKLLEIFGYSGLARYEKMLAEQERRALPGPMIEHEERTD